MQHITRISPILADYDVLFLDLWGVIHDGSHLYPGVHEALKNIREAGKEIVLISNAPRRAKKVESVLGQLGLEPALYDLVMSSGEMGYQWLAQFQPSPLEGEGRVGVSHRLLRKSLPPTLTLPLKGGGDSEDIIITSAHPRMPTYWTGWITGASMI